MRSSARTYKKKKASKVTEKTHRKNTPRTKQDFQKLFRERYFI